ncbi:MAG: tetratricopeptide repeat protein [Bdellovibrionales bacterium]|nr:tetratricopeptide repeat protein [Bdellovibrionales bacterium]
MSTIKKVLLNLNFKKSPICILFFLTFLFHLINPLTQAEDVTDDFSTENQNWNEKNQEPSHKNRQEKSVYEKNIQNWKSEKKWDLIISTLNPRTDEISSSGLLNLTMCYMEKKDFVNVIRILNLLSEKNPNDPMVLYMLGDAKLKLSLQTKDLKQKRELENDALDKFRNSIRINKKFPLAHRALFYFLLRTKMNSEAIEQIHEMQKIFGKKADLQSDLCRLLTITGFLDQALIQCPTAIHYNKKNAENYIYLAQSYFYTKEVQKSERILVQTAKNFPKSEIAQFSAGQFFYVKNNFPVALKYLKQAVAVEPESGRSQLIFAKTLFETGSYTEAMDHYSKACQSNPQNQSEFLAAAARLRLKSENTLATKYSQSAVSFCK